MKKLFFLALILFAAVGVTAAFATEAPAEEPAPVDLELSDVLPGTVFDQITAPIAECPRTGIYCLDVYDPVTCSNGVTYPNACYAYVACATGCGSGGV